MLPPSATVAADDVSVIVVASASSTTVGVVVLVVVNASELAPLVPGMLTVSVSLPFTYGLSARTLKAALSALLDPTGIVIVWPFDSVTTSGVPVTALLTVAV